MKNSFSVPNLKAVPQHLNRCVLPTRSHDSAARMTGRSAHVKTFDRRAMVGPAGKRAHHVKLIEIHRALENVAAGQTVGPLDIKRTENLPVFNDVWDIGRVFSKPLNTTVGE